MFSLYVCVCHLCTWYLQMSKVPRSPGTPVLDDCEPPPECWGLNPGPLEEQSVLLSHLQFQENLKTFFFKYYFCLCVYTCVCGIRACVSAGPHTCQRGPEVGSLELEFCSLWATHHGCWSLNSWSSLRAVYSFQLYEKLFALVIYSLAIRPDWDVDTEITIRSTGYNYKKIIIFLWEWFPLKT